MATTEDLMDHGKQHEETLGKTVGGDPASGAADRDPPALSTPATPMTATRAEVTSTTATLALPETPTESSQQKEPQQQRRYSAVPAPAPVPEKQHRPGHARSNTWQAPSTSSGSSASQGSPPRGRGQRQRVDPPRTVEQIQVEHQYLFSDLHRQDARVRALLSTLSTVQAQLQEASAPAEARRLRKNAGYIQSKIADAEQQERLVMARIGEVFTEQQSCHRLAQLQQQQQQRQQIWTQGPAGAGSPHGLVQQQLPQTPYLVPYDSWSPQHQHQDQNQYQPTAATHLIIPPSFIVSPVTPGIHATMPASPVSPAASLTGGFMSPMSPLAPVFQPGSSFYFPPVTPQAEKDGVAGVAGDNDAASSAACIAGLQEESEVAVGQAGMHGASDAVNEAVDEAAEDAVDAERDSDATYPPKDAVRERRVSHSAARPSEAKQKHMSLPPARFSWPEEPEP